MARGGARPGAGRKPGVVTKAKQLAILRAKEAAEAGTSPLEYMLEVMRTSKDPKRRDAMAIAAAPYLHPRLASVEHKGNEESPLEVINRIELTCGHGQG